MSLGYGLEAMEREKILLLIPYFGKWPVWFPAFLQSCKTNRSIDWIFFTDCDIPNVAVDNVRFLPLTLREFNSLASAKLGFEVQIPRPYKVCDFRPAFGLIFAEYLKGYDFWGHCDIDVVFGDIRKYITSQILDQSDIVSAQRERICGHFTLYRNTDKVNELFTVNPDYRFLLSDTVYKGLEEYHLTRIVKTSAERGAIRVHWSKNLANFSHSTNYGPTAYLAPFINRFYWVKGKLYNCNDEIMYMHFMNWKRSLKSCSLKYCDLSTDDIDSFFISYSHIGLSESDRPPIATGLASLIAWYAEYWSRRTAALRCQLRKQGLSAALKKIAVNLPAEVLGVTFTIK